MSITVKYGAGNSLTLNPETTQTWGDVLSTERVEVGLGLPGDTSRLAIHVNNVEVDASAVVQDGDIASLTTRANQKG